MDKRAQKPKSILFYFILYLLVFRLECTKRQLIGQYVVSFMGVVSGEANLDRCWVCLLYTSFIKLTRQRISLNTGRKASANVLSYIRTTSTICGQMRCPVSSSKKSTHGFSKLLMATSILSNEQMRSGISCYRTTVVYTCLLYTSRCV